MDDPGVRRHDPEILECVLSPAEELVALAVAAEFELGVAQKRQRGSRLVDLHRVVDDELDGLQGIDLPGIAAHLLHGVAHRGQVDHGGYTREILEQNPARTERDLAVRLGGGIPPGQAPDVVGRHRRAVFVAQQVLEQDLEREGQPRRIEPLLAEGVKTVVMVGLPFDSQRAESG